MLRRGKNTRILRDCLLKRSRKISTSYLFSSKNPLERGIPYEWNPIGSFICSKGSNRKSFHRIQFQQNFSQNPSFQTSPKVVRYFIIWKARPKNPQSFASIEKPRYLNSKTTQLRFYTTSTELQLAAPSSL